jgi:hypothetical protein
MQGVWRARALIYSLYGISTLIPPLVGGISVDFARTDSTYASLYDDVTIRFFYLSPQNSIFVYRS